MALGASLADNSFYRKKLASGGLAPADLRGHASLSRIPLTTKREVSAAQAASPPFGGLMSFPRHHYRHVHRTSGTTGRPLFWLDTEEDWAVWQRGWSMVYQGAGVGRDDVVFCAFSFGPYIAHWTAMAGVAGVGALAVAGGGMRTTERLRMMLDLEATVLVSTPTYALRMAEVAAQEGIDVAGGPLRITIHAGEPGASLPHVRERLQNLWGAVSYDHAGATEIGAWSYPCEAQALHLNELDFVFEVLDPATGELVADGEQGELVITTLGRLGMPAVRYRTGDLVVRDRTTCRCGRTLARLVGGVLGRADDMVIVRGVNVYPSAIDNLVRASPEVIEYRLEILRDPDRMRLAIETSEADDHDAACAALVGRFRTQLDLAVDVQAVASGVLPRFEAKAKRVHIVESA